MSKTLRNLCGSKRSSAHIFIAALITVFVISVLNAGLAIASPSAALSLDAPANLKQGQSGNLEIIISSNETFDGAIALAGTMNYLNATDPIGVHPTDFSGSGPYSAVYSIAISGNTVGTNTINAALSDTAAGMTLNATQASVEITDGIAPTIISSSPSGAQSSQSITISATTDEAAECRYSTADKQYNLMENLLGTGSGFTTTHILTLTFLDGTTTLYVRCADGNGNAMAASTVISFSIATTPTADIRLSKEPPLTAGIIEVTVVTSKNMADVLLSYSFSDSPTAINSIPLAGSGNIWKGFMIIPETSVTRIATFAYSGTDTDGRIGTRITNGKIFIIDTSKPKTITDISAIGEIGRIKIKWFYDGETGKFNVYKSQSSDVSYVDLYETTNDSFFSDRNVNPDKTYYYRVAAVTGSGNVGPLSSIVEARADRFIASYGHMDENGTAMDDENRGSASRQKEEASEPEMAKEISSYVLKKTEEKSDEVSSLLLDIEKSEEDLQRTDDSVEKDAIQNLGLLDMIAEEKAKLIEIRSQLTGYKTTYIDESEFNKTIGFIDVKLKKIRMSVPKKIIVTDKSAYVQPIDDNDILSASNSVQNETEIEETLPDNRRLNKNIKVEVNYKTVELTYLDGTEETKTIVDKRISLESAEPAKDVLLVETIPKTLAQSADDIEFRTKYIKVIKNDPVVALELDELSYDATRLTYILKGKKDIEEIKRAKTVAIGNSLSSKNSSPLSGFSIFSVSGDVTLFDWIIIAGVLLLVSLIGYYFMFLREEPLRIDRKEMHGLLPEGSQAYSNQPAHQQAHGYKDNDQISHRYSHRYNAQNGDSSASDANRNHSQPNGNQDHMTHIATGRKAVHKVIEKITGKSTDGNSKSANTEHLKRIVNEGHFHIDNLNYAFANDIYHQAIQMYPRINVAMNERGEIDTSINALYSKLLLLSKINDAHRSLERNDRYNAMMQLDDIARLNNEVTRRNRNTTLAEYSIGWQNKLQKQLLG